MDALHLLDADELLALIRHDIQSERLDSALPKIKVALEMPQISTELLAVAAKTYAQLGLFSRAENLFRELLEALPDADNERFQYGLVIFEQGRFRDAIDAWMQVLTNIENHPPALYYSGLALRALGEDAAAERSWQQLLSTAQPTNLYYPMARDELVRAKSTIN